MLYNRDGSRYDGQSVHDEIERRFNESGDRAPYLSDILGSDWGWSIRPDETLREAAYRIAKIHYEDEAGILDAAYRSARDW